MQPPLLPQAAGKHSGIFNVDEVHYLRHPDPHIGIVEISHGRALVHVRTSAAIGKRRARYGGIAHRSVGCESNAVQDRIST